VDKSACFGILPCALPRNKPPDVRDDPIRGRGDKGATSTAARAAASMENDNDNIIILKKCK